MCVRCLHTKLPVLLVYCCIWFYCCANWKFSHNFSYYALLHLNGVVVMLVPLLWLLTLSDTIAVDSLRGRSKKSASEANVGLEASIRKGEQKLQRVLEYERTLDQQRLYGQARAQFALESLQVISTLAHRLITHTHSIFMTKACCFCVLFRIHTDSWPTPLIIHLLLTDCFNLR